MTKKWSIASAKAQLSRVIADSHTEPQVIENRGIAVAVMIETEAYQRLLRTAVRSQPSERLREFVALSRAISDEGGVDLELPRREPRRSPFSKRR